MPFSGSGTGIQNADDVFFSSLANGQALVYDTATAKWQNQTIGGGSSYTVAKDTAASGNVTLTSGSSAVLTKFTGTLTADRTIILAGTAANAYFELSMIETVFNGYSITVTNGVFSHAFSYQTYTKYAYIGSAWERVL